MILSLGCLDENQESELLDHQCLEARRKVAPALTPIEGKSVSETKQRRFGYGVISQGGNTHIQRARVWVSFIMRRSTVKRVEPSFRTVLPGLVCLFDQVPLANFLVSFFSPDWSRTLPNMGCTLLA